MSPRTGLPALLLDIRPLARSRRLQLHFSRPAVYSSPSTLSDRAYATHKSTTPPTGSSDRFDAPLRGQSGGSAFDGRESVGPFPLGVGPSGRRKAWRSWSELGLGGKLVRTTQQTGNLSVILVGGGLFVILAFALTTELFAKNSPSVLYAQAVDMIRASDTLNPHLLPPLSFTHTPHASAPVRGSPPLPHRFVRHPTSGRDHMLLTFWVHGRGRDEPEPMSWLKSGWRVAEGWACQAGEWAGLVQPREEVEVPRSAFVRETEGGKEREQRQEQGPGMLGRLFGGITRQPGGREVRRGLPPPGTYKVGEVRADYVKNASGQFQLLSLVIDVPGSSAPHPSRAIVFWSPEADTEGLQGRIR